MSTGSTEEPARITPPVAEIVTEIIPNASIKYDEKGPYVPAQPDPAQHRGEGQSDSPPPAKNVTL